MARYINFQVLDVGQGTGNFIELRDDADHSLVATILLDLGSERAARHAAGGPTVEYVVATLKEMAQPTIDILMFSHGDSDHVNLVPDLLAAFEPFGTDGVPAVDTLKIKTVRYGGDFAKYEKRGTQILEKVRKYMPDDDELESVAYKTTSFSKGDKSKPMLTLEDIAIYMMMGNCANAAAEKGAKKRKLDSFVVNTNSLVVVIIFGGVQFVATGDATGTTLRQCNDVITAPIKSTFLDNVYMMTLPHHGSATTTFNMRGIKGGDAEINLRQFVDNLTANTITGSAERVRTFKHPSAVVMSYFWERLSGTVYYADPLLTDDRHFYTAHFEGDGGFRLSDGKHGEDWPRLSWWYSVQTTSNVFTNLYYEYDMQGEAIIPPNPGEVTKGLAAKPLQPPLGVAWTYRVLADGTKSLALMVNRPSLLALRYAIVDGVAPSDLPVPSREEMRREREMQFSKPAPAALPAAAPSLGAEGPALEHVPTRMRRLRVIP